MTTEHYCLHLFFGQGDQTGDQLPHYTVTCYQGAGVLRLVLHGFPGPPLGRGLEGGHDEIALFNPVFVGVRP